MASRVLSTRRLAVALAIVVVVSARTAGAQTATPTPPAPAPAPAAHQVLICDDCPKRRVGRAFLGVTLVNVVYEAANLARGQATARITPSTWWTNMKRGWEWDLDDFVVNQIGHPYQGNNYFNTARANGLSFWESAGLTAFGSGTWEYFGETNQASLNDLINTTLGGVALGEMFHRTAWLLRRPGGNGKTSRAGEIAAMAFDPIGGASRMAAGDWTRPLSTPRDLVPPAVNATGLVGALWRGSSSADTPTGTYAFLETDLLYGDLSTPSTTPYDAFAVRLGFGGGSALSEARVRGRLFGAAKGRTTTIVAQAYDYNANPAYQFGAQAVEAGVSFNRQHGEKSTLALRAWGGVTILGAVDSVPLTGKVDEPVDPDAEQGVSTGPRYYDYGPGGNAGMQFAWDRSGHRLVNATWEIHHLHSLDGVRANHLLARYRADLVIPITKRVGLGVSGELFDRRTFHQNGERRSFHFPQARVFLAWSAR